MRYFGCSRTSASLIEFMCTAVCALICALIMVTTVSYEGWRQFHSKARN
jgi:hypothetical protein